MTAQPYFGDTMTMTVTAPDDATDIPVAGLKGVTLMLSAEHVKLYTADSIERESVKKRELETPVEIEYAKWDEAFAQWWMAGDAGSTATSVTDTSDVSKFTIDGTVTSADGTTTLQATVQDVFFEEFPLWDASEGEFISQNISGEGRTVSDFSVQA